MSNALNRLRELTEQIPDHNPGVMIHDKLILHGGMGVATCLMKNRDVAISHAELHRGATMADHYHHEREIIIVVKGKLLYRDDGGEQVIKTAGALIIEPNTCHYAEALTDCDVIAITVPASKGFPDAK